MRYQDTGWAEFEIDELRVSMNAPDSLSDFGQLKRRVIEPAVRELIRKDNWLIQLTRIKAGKKVVRVRFDFQKNPQQRLPF